MVVAWNLITIVVAGIIVWAAMQWMAQRATSGTSRVDDLSMYTPPQHDPCDECEGVGGISGLRGVSLCPSCNGTGIQVFQ